MDEATVARFWSKVDRSKTPPPHAGDIGNCWEWTACRVRGYGMFSVTKGKMVGAHRVSWKIHHGDPGAMCVLHRCDNRACVNPRHLFIGTQADNVADRESKGRNVISYGEKHGNSRLTEDQVRAIRECDETLSEIARRFGISEVHAWKIRSRKLWPHI